MHVTSQYQRVNNSMSIDSSNLGSSKLNMKKTPFYKHQDPSKLNYYARFSPKRKMLNQQFHQDILKGSSPLSPRTSKASSKQKKSPKSVRRKVFKDQAQQTLKNKFQLIDPNILISVNDAHHNRGQIYIDQNEEPSNDDYSNQEPHLDQNALILNNSHEPRFNNPRNILDIPIHQNPKESSQSQQSSSFQRMIQPSSSQDNDIPYVLNLKKSGGQMLIEDDQDSETETQNNPKRFKIQSPIKILDGSQQKILQLAKSIGAYKKDETEKKEVKSQNISFSVDSDLSLMEQKWNSYFQSGHQDESQQNQQSKRQIFSQNLIQHRKNYYHGQQIFEQNQNKMSSSSEEQLPSFSNPDTSSYLITPLESKRQSMCSQETYNMIDFEDNNQAKQFKRQFTFGNQLNAAFQHNMSQKQQNSYLKQPLFKKFLLKSTIENFKNQNYQKKQKFKNISIQNKIPTLETKKTVILDNKNARKSLILNQKNRNFVPQNISIIPQQPSIQQPKQEQKMSQNSQSFQVQTKKGNQILIIQEQAQQQENTTTFSYIKINSCQVTQHLDKPLLNKFQKLQIRMKFQQTLKSIDENQKKQKDFIIKSQNQNKVMQNHGQQIKIDDPSQTQENDSLADHQKETTQKINKNIEPNSYSKIFSEKRFYRMRKGSYNDRAKISQSQYQSSQEEQISQKDNKYSKQKSQGGESITTATQQVYQSPQISVHYFLKNRQNCLEQVENLKKYLQRIQNSPLSGKQKNTKKNIFDLNENFESDGMQNDQKNVSLESSYFDKSQCKNQKEQQRFQLTKIITNKPNQNFSNNILPQSYEPRQVINSCSNQQKQTPIKLIQKQSQTQKQPKLKKDIVTYDLAPLVNHRCFQKSLTMLQQLIPQQPQQLSRIYEKVYTQVYQQQLKGQQKLQKQQFLINLMENFLQAENQKLDCQNYLTHQFQTSKISRTEAIFQPQKDENDLQILINKHIILGLVRNLVNR